LTRSRAFWIPFLLLIGVLALVLGTNYRSELSDLAGGSSSRAADQLPPEFDRLAEVWKLLQEEHIDGGSLDAEALSAGSIRGLLQALDDPYASFLNAEQYQVESQDFKGFFEGIGAHVSMRDGQLVIIAPMQGSPAEKAGIRPGDEILAINGGSTAQITLLEAVSKIRGKKGTSVDLLVLHLNQPEPLTITVIRGVIPLDSVRLTMLADGVGHLRIFSFGDKTNEELEKALKEFKDAEGTGLVLDLRNNPGGLLRSVVDVAGQFLDDGLVLYEVNAQGERRDWDAESGGDGRDIPLVVLVNQFSASASEVLSGALMDHDRAEVIGVTTFGKGSVNTLRPLSDGSGVYFTIGRWYTPLGTLIEGEGITPDIIVDIPPDSVKDVQLSRAVEILQRQVVQSR
jgi:carboxyl-terminal processing protease